MRECDRLFVAEAQAGAKRLAEYLGRGGGAPMESEGDFFRVGDDVVTWIGAALLEPAPAQVYHPRFEHWTLEDLPLIPPSVLLRPRTDPRDPSTVRVTNRLDLLGQLVGGCKTLVGCTNPDAEGQLRLDALLTYLQNTKMVWRIWALALDDVSLDAALSTMRPNSEYANWHDAALTRVEADWLYGINMTRAATLHARAAGAWQGVIHIGRTQTPVLNLVVQRETEILATKRVHQPTPFIDVATVPMLRATWLSSADASERHPSKPVAAPARGLDSREAEKIAATARAAGVATVVNVHNTAGTEAPPMPFCLVALQAHCCELHDFTAHETQHWAQALYAKGLISYPAVDCEYLPERLHAQTGRTLASLSKASFPSGVARAILGAKPSLHNAAWNDSEVSSHHGIVPNPLDRPGVVATLEKGEREIYLAIVWRYLLQFWPSAKFVDTEVVLTCGGADADLYYAKGRRYTDDGWRRALAFWGDDLESTPCEALPLLHKGQATRIAGAGVDNLATPIPDRYTEGTLVLAMRQIARHVRNLDYRKQLDARRSNGLGTPSTRAATLEALKQRGQLFRQGRELLPADEAISLMGLLPAQVRAPDSAAMWGVMHDEVLRRSAARSDLTQQYAPWLRKMVAGWATAFPRSPTSPQRATGPKPKRSPPSERAKYACPKCDAGTLRRIRRRDGSGYFWGCGNFSDGCKGASSDKDGQPDLVSQRSTRTESAAT